MDGELLGGVKKGSALRPGSPSLNFFLCWVLGVKPAGTASKHEPISSRDVTVLHGTGLAAA